jgi:Rieske Fe-S protein
VGGGVLVDVGDGVVVTRPTASTVKAFSAVCTHEGCTITGVEEGEMVCPCHGSRFRISDGAVARGPARRRLDPVSFTVVNGRILFA